jgi:membrane associated rhomboid family serine protease
MIFTPIGRDNAVIQRHAWVTYGIMGFYVLMFVIVNISSAGAVRKFTEDVRAIEVLITREPGLNLPKQLEVILGPAKYKELNDLAGSPAKRPSDAQKRLDGLAVSAVENYRNIGEFKYSFLPIESSIFKVFLTMWVQFSFWVLITDLLVLFSTAPYIEDVFGRPAFAILYLGGAFASAMAYQAWFKNPDMGLFGASGAISAVVGAFLVRFYKSKLEFLFVPLIWRPNWRFRFFIPAFVIIPLWVMLQIFVATRGTGAAAVVNLGGFVFGAFYGACLVATKYEDKHVRPVVAQQTEWVLNDHLTRAFDARDASDAATMQVELMKFFNAKPANAEETQTAVDLTAEALAMPSASTQFCSQAANFAERNRAFEVAVRAYDRACQLDPSAPLTVRHLLRLGALKKQTGDVIGARTALMRAKTHSACSEEVRATIEARLAQLKV